jgi:hypothetical protein
MTLVTGSPRFVFSSTIASDCCPDQPEFSHAASAFMAALPYLEPYFIYNVREVASSLKARHAPEAALLVDRGAGHCDRVAHRENSATFGR